MQNREENEVTIVPDNRQMRREKMKKKRRKRRIVTGLSIIAALMAGYAMGRFHTTYLLKQQESIEAAQLLAEEETEDATADTESAEAMQENPDIVGGANLSENGIQPAEYLEYGITVGEPVDFSLYQALKQIRSVESTDERYSKILEDPSIYPEPMLVNLANNPEQLEFVYQYPQSTTDTSKAVLTKEELEEECPHFLQWDSRWGYLSYGDNSNMAVSGCGPTSLAMVAVGLTKNETYTPAMVAEYAMDNNYYMNGVGTKWDLMLQGAQAFGLTSRKIGINGRQMEKALDQGEYLILSMNTGTFTTGGHFIVIYDYDDQGFYVNDPSCVYRSKKQWTYEDLAKEIKGIWAIGADSNSMNGYEREEAGIE